MNVKLVTIEDMQLDLTTLFLSASTLFLGCSFEAGRSDFTAKDAALPGNADASGGHNDGGLVAVDAGPAQSCQPLVGGDDDFEDGILAAFWTKYNDANIRESVGVLSLTPTPNQADFNTGAVFSGNFTLSLIDKRVFLELVDVGNQDNAADFGFRFGNDNVNFNFTVRDNMLSFSHVGSPGGVIAEAPYDPVAHRYLQLREEDGFVYGEIGTTANNWTLFGREAVDSNSEIQALSGSYIGIGGSAYEASPDPGVVKIDNFNTGSSCP